MDARTMERMGHLLSAMIADPRAQEKRGVVVDGTDRDCDLVVSTSAQRLTLDRQAESSPSPSSTPSCSNRPGGCAAPARHWSSDTQEVSPESGAVYE
ncbi:MAG: hypothetical protein ACRDIL_17250, partial [Candidatus Limnocylindrales bacterium]